MASWVAWYQPWGEREPEDMMQIAEAPGRMQMSDQDIFVYEQAKKEWFFRLREKQNNVGEEDPIPILEIIPGHEDESEDEYKKRAEIVIKFGQKLEQMSEDGELPPIDRLIDEEFLLIYEKYRCLFEEAYRRAEHEFAQEQDGQEKEDLPSEDPEKISSSHGNIYVAPINTKFEYKEYFLIPLTA
jgi:hypothetical protein